MVSALVQLGPARCWPSMLSAIWRRCSFGCSFPALANRWESSNRFTGWTGDHTSAACAQPQPFSRRPGQQQCGAAQPAVPRTVQRPRPVAGGAVLADKQRFEAVVAKGLAPCWSMLQYMGGSPGHSKNGAALPRSPVIRISPVRCARRNPARSLRSTRADGVTAAVEAVADLDALAKLRLYVRPLLGPAG